MRNAAPLKERKDEGFGIGSILGLVWAVTLVQWLVTKGMNEVLISAFEERFSPIPFAFFVSLLVGIIIKEWMCLLSLSDAEINLYYPQKTKAYNKAE